MFPNLIFQNMKANFLSDFWEAVDLWVAVATDSMSHLVSKVFQYFQNLEFPRDYYIILCVFCLLIVPCVKKSGILKKITSKIKNLKQTNPKLRWLWGLKWPIIIVSFVLFWPVYYALFIIQLIGYFGLFKGNKIKRHRDLFSKDGYPLLGLSAKFAFIVPITLWIVVTVISRFNSEYMEQSLIHDDYKIFEIICQYLDPGNVANSQGLGSGIALISALLGIVCLSGFLVSAIVNVISQTRIQWQKGLINYNGVKKFKEYVVIIGINEQTASIARSALDSDDNRYVLIQTRQDVEKVRPELESKIDDDKQDRIVYYAGDRTSYEDIEKLHLEKAIEVYILGESVENSDKKKNDDQLEKEHDAYNISCLEHISECRKKYVEKENKEEKPRLNVHVQFDYQSTFTAFKATHLYQKLGRNIRFIPFNIHELWAKKVLVDNLAIYPAGNKTELKVQRYNPIDTYVDKADCNTRKGITVGCPKTVHLVILGMNQMGTALATQAALLCHFPNFATDKSKKTVITFIDDNAIKEADYYMGRYSTLFELSHYRIGKIKGDGAKGKGAIRDELEWKVADPFKTGKYDHLITEDDMSCLLDVEWEFIQGNAASRPIQNYIKELVVKDNGEDTDKTVTIAICFNDSQQALAAAMYLPKIIYDNCNQVLVYQRSIFDVANDVARGDSEWRRYHNLFPFGMAEASYTENPFDSHMAALDYYLYVNADERDRIRSYYDSKGEKEYERYGRDFLDRVDASWEQVGIVRKTASIDSVDSIAVKLRSLKISSRRDITKIKEKTHLPSYEMVESEHLRWMMQRLISGFRHLSAQEQQVITESEIAEKERLIEGKTQIDRACFSICSNRRMKMFSKDVGKKDKEVIKTIPYLIMGTELLNLLILYSNRYKHTEHKKTLSEVYTFDNKKSFIFISGKKESGIEENRVFCEHDFWIAETAVTQGLWSAVTGQARKDSEDLLPVVSVSKNEVEDFLVILRKKSGLFFDLPSQKEWRTAADMADMDNCNISTKSRQKTAPVEARIQGLTGKLHHYFGNVWEWSHDEDKRNSYKFMGGSFRFQENECKPNDKREEDKKNHYWWHSWSPDSKSDDLGFRLVWKYEYDIPNIGADSPVTKDDSSLKGTAGVMDWFNQEKHKMIEVKGGSFIMGADKMKDRDKNYGNPDYNEGPSHMVQISNSFYMCQVPVTQALWNIVMGIENPKKNPTEHRSLANLPQTDVSWAQIEEEFLVEINSVLSSPQLINGFKRMGIDIEKDRLQFRLPTEAEWEYACKGGQYARNPYPLFSSSENKTKAEDVAWFDQPSIHEVAKKEPNALGLFDMSGNVWEWCYDYYIADMYEACKIGENEKVQNTFFEHEYQKKGYITDPVAMDPEYSAHVFRGGSWRSSKWDCRCTRANYWGENYKSNDLGFRLVLGRPIEELGKSDKDKEYTTAPAQS